MAKEQILLGLIERIYATVYDPSHWRACLTALRDATGSDSAGRVVLDAAAPQARLVDELVCDESSTREYEQHYWRTDTFHEAYQRSGALPGRAWASHWFVPDAEAERSEFHGEFLRRLDLFYFAGVTVHQLSTAVTSLGVIRARRRSPFSTAETDLIQVLAPHFQYAATIERRLRSTLAAGATLGGLLETAADGIAVLGSRGQVLGMNRSAEHVFSEGDGLGFDSRGVWALRRGDDKRLSGLIATALGRTGAVPGAKATAVTRPSGRPAYQLIAWPAPTPDHICAAGMETAQPAAILMIGDPAALPAPSAESLRQIYGLSPRQAELAARLATGETLASAARAMGISPGTARAVLQRVFTKTGTRRQAQLVAVLASIARFAGSGTH